LKPNCDSNGELITAIVVSSPICYLSDTIIRVLADFGYGSTVQYE
jgi:hypothetical protein